LASLLCIREFANDEGILEIGSGTGLWSALLKTVGACNVHAIDERIPLNGFCSVEDCGHMDAIERYGYGEESLERCETLFVCWPPMSSMAAEAVEKFRGKRVVYIGEGPYGCTGDLELHELLGFGTDGDEFHKRAMMMAREGAGKAAGKGAEKGGNWRLVFELQNPVWPDVYDACYMFERVQPVARGLLANLLPEYNAGVLPARCATASP